VTAQLSRLKRSSSFWRFLVSYNKRLLTITRAQVINFPRFWFCFVIFCTIRFYILWKRGERKIHKYFPSRRAMTWRSIGHERKKLQHKCFHNKWIYVQWLWTMMMMPTSSRSRACQNNLCFRNQISRTHDIY
jgi:hypothetical protein